MSLCDSHTFLHIDCSGIGLKKRRKKDENVRVFLRIRAEEGEESAFLNVVDGSTLHAEGYEYKYDRIFDGRSCQNQDEEHNLLCSTIARPIVDSLKDGYNSTVITYGGVRSGKSSTLYGAVIPGVLCELFGEQSLRDPKYVFKIRCSYFQIIGEKIYDLLRAERDETGDTVDLRYLPSLGVVMENLSSHEVKSLEDVQALLDFGWRVRALTTQGEKSHTCLSFLIQSYARVHLPTVGNNATETHGAEQNESTTASSAKRRYQRIAPRIDAGRRSPRSPMTNDTSTSATTKRREAMPAAVKPPTANPKDNIPILKTSCLNFFDLAGHDITDLDNECNTSLTKLASHVQMLPKYRNSVAAQRFTTTGNYASPQKDLFGPAPPLPGRKSAKYSKVNASICSTRSNNSVLLANKVGTGGSNLNAFMNSCMVSDNEDGACTDGKDANIAKQAADKDAAFFLPELRETKLSMLLAHALCGNSRTCVIGCLHADLSAETLQTLSLTFNCKNFMTRSAANVISGLGREALLDKLYADTRKMELQLRVGGSGGRLTGDHALMYSLLASDILRFNEEDMASPEKRYALCMNGLNTSTKARFEYLAAQLMGAWRAKTVVNTAPPNIIAVEAKLEGAENLLSPDGALADEDIMETDAFGNDDTTRKELVLEPATTHLAPTHALHDAATLDEAMALANAKMAAENPAASVELIEAGVEKSEKPASEKLDTEKPPTEGAPTGVDDSAAENVSEYFRSVQMQDEGYLMNLHADKMLDKLLKFSLRKHKTTIGVEVLYSLNDSFIQESMFGLAMHPPDIDILLPGKITMEHVDNAKFNASTSFSFNASTSVNQGISGIAKPGRKDGLASMIFTCELIMEFNSESGAIEQYVVQPINGFRNVRDSLLSINGEVSEAGGKCSHGDVISIGPHRFQFVIPRNAKVSDSTRQAAQEEASRAETEEQKNSLSMSERNSSARSSPRSQRESACSQPGSQRSQQGSQRFQQGSLKTPQVPSSEGTPSYPINTPTFPGLKKEHNARKAAEKSSKTEGKSTKIPVEKARSPVEKSTQETPTKGKELDSLRRELAAMTKKCAELAAVVHKHDRSPQHDAKISIMQSSLADLARATETMKEDSLSQSVKSQKERSEKSVSIEVSAEKGRKFSPAARVGDAKQVKSVEAKRLAVDAKMLAGKKKFSPVNQQKKSPDSAEGENRKTSGSPGSQTGAQSVVEQRSPGQRSPNQEVAAKPLSNAPKYVSNLKPLEKRKPGEPTLNATKKFCGIQDDSLNSGLSAISPIYAIPSGASGKGSPGKGESSFRTQVEDSIPGFNEIGVIPELSISESHVSPLSASNKGNSLNSDTKSVNQDHSAEVPNHDITGAGSTLSAQRDQTLSQGANGIHSQGTGGEKFSKNVSSVGDDTPNVANQISFILVKTAEDESVAAAKEAVPKQVLNPQQASESSAGVNKLGEREPVVPQVDGPMTSKESRNQLSFGHQPSINTQSALVSETTHASSTKDTLPRFPSRGEIAELQQPEDPSKVTIGTFKTPRSFKITAPSLSLAPLASSRVKTETNSVASEYDDRDFQDTQQGNMQRMRSGNVQTPAFGMPSNSANVQSTGLVTPAFLPNAHSIGTVGRQLLSKDSVATSGSVGATSTSTLASNSGYSMKNRKDPNAIWKANYATPVIEQRDIQGSTEGSHMKRPELREPIHTTSNQVIHNQPVHTANVISTHHQGVTHHEGAHPITRSENVSKTTNNGDVSSNLGEAVTPRDHMNNAKRSMEMLKAKALNTFKKRLVTPVNAASNPNSSKAMQAASGVLKKSPHSSPLSTQRTSNASSPNSPLGGGMVNHGGIPTQAKNISVQTATPPVQTRVVKVTATQVRSEAFVRPDTIGSGSKIRSRSSDNANPRTTPTTFQSTTPGSLLTPTGGFATFLSTRAGSMTPTMMGCRVAPVPAMTPVMPTALPVAGFFPSTPGPLPNTAGMLLPQQGKMPTTGRQTSGLSMPMQSPGVSLPVQTAATSAPTAVTMPMSVPHAGMVPQQRTLGSMTPGGPSFLKPVQLQPIRIGTQLMEKKKEPSPSTTKETRFQTVSDTGTNQETVSKETVLAASSDEEPKIGAGLTNGQGRPSSHQAQQAQQGYQLEIGNQMKVGMHMGAAPMSARRVGGTATRTRKNFIQSNIINAGKTTPRGVAAPPAWTAYHPQFTQVVGNISKSTHVTSDDGTEKPMVVQCAARQVAATSGAASTGLPTTTTNAEKLRAVLNADQTGIAQLFCKPEVKEKDFASKGRLMFDPALNFSKNFTLTLGKLSKPKIDIVDSKSRKIGPAGIESTEIGPGKGHTKESMSTTGLASDTIPLSSVVAKVDTGISKEHSKEKGKALFTPRVTARNDRQGAGENKVKPRRGPARNRSVSPVVSGSASAFGTCDKKKKPFSPKKGTKKIKGDEPTSPRK